MEPKFEAKEKNNITWLLHGIETAWNGWSEGDPIEEATYKPIIDDLKKYAKEYEQTLSDATGDFVEDAKEALRRLKLMVGEEK